ncbi:hypothetical protein EJ02DRAFT_338373 [Clathrospora elynae]|uniref:Uncharacterized protein n=1 Tax=Clathrospora elynae TaxID=706981 RepID=A0A6A5T034_9PLEO|nr:hypothetical protein EJ02DRAFT_338373 [Clathrospora elynae]
MANNNDNPRRDPGRPEDNPFIAFRRFADSQVSSLLNTVFTLPATIANYNNAHQAREQCLFGKVDQRQCEKLHEIEGDIAELRHEGRDLFRAGDMQAVLRNSEELMRLDRKADELRRDIVGPTKLGGHDGGAEMVEWVANQKGQEWGWMWDWGFPRPFDSDTQTSRATSERDMAREQLQLDLMLRLQSEARRLAVDFDDKARDDLAEDGKPRVWLSSKSWQWPPPADASRSDDVYSPRVLEQDENMKKTGVHWRAAYEDLVRTEQNERPHCMLSDEPARRGPWGRRKIPISQRQLEENMESDDGPRCPRVMNRDTHDEPSYEYSHDHEDQHDDPPTPRKDQFPLIDTRTAKEMDGIDDDEAETELDAYEQLDAARAPVSAAVPVFPTMSERTHDMKPSILSTLTTTERSVAPDGSVTTKVILKKRFADGREENSETVHTQRGQEPQNPWRALHQSAQAQPTENQINKDGGKKRSGWFWSS